jgi:hypothetical protein
MTESENVGVLDTALIYANLGLRVIPVLEGSKKPAMKSWPKLASTDPEVLTKWFEQKPKSNLGIVAGGGILVVDVDKKNGGFESFEKLFAGEELPVTATAITGSGGRHYFFRVDPRLELGNRQNLMPGIDIRGKGGFVVSCPSIHPETKQRYEWLRHPREGIAPAPAFLLEKLKKPTDGPQFNLGEGLSFPRKASVEELQTRIIAKFPVTGRGQRYGQMVRAVGSLLGQGYDPGRVCQAVVGWWKHFHDLELIGTSTKEASREVKACIQRTLDNPNFKQSLGLDHRAELGRIELDAQQRRLIFEAFVSSEGNLIMEPTSNRETDTHHTQQDNSTSNRETTHAHAHQTHSTSNRVTNKLCSTEHERVFVDAHLVYFGYKRRIGENPVRGTRDQIRELIEDRYMIELDNTQFERLKQKYITREGKPATRYELLRQTQAGRQGFASVFGLTGILNLMGPPEPSGGLQTASTIEEDAAHSSPAIAS